MHVVLKGLLGRVFLPQNQGDPYLLLRGKPVITDEGKEHNFHLYRSLFPLVPPPPCTTRVMFGLSLSVYRQWCWQCGAQVQGQINTQRALEICAAIVTLGQEQFLTSSYLLRLIYLKQNIIHIIYII